MASSSPLLSRLAPLLLSLLALFTSCSSSACPQYSLPAQLDFGSCPNPGITYTTSHPHGDTASQKKGFAPTNQTQFPHSFTTDIAALESYICSRLQSSHCGASTSAVNACELAFWNYAGLAGHWAVDAWNDALGLNDHLGNDKPASNDYRVTCTLTTVTTTATVPSGAELPQTSVPHPVIPPAFGTSTSLVTEVLTTTVVFLSPTILTLYPTSTQTGTVTVTVWTTPGGGGGGGSSPTDHGSADSTDTAVVDTTSTSTDSTVTTDTSTTTTVTTTTTTSTSTSVTTPNPNAANTDGSPFADTVGGAGTRTDPVYWLTGTVIGLMSCMIF